MFLTEKHDNSCKGQMVYNGKPTHERLSCENAASPTVVLESIMLTAIGDAKEGHDVMAANIPVIIKITGVLVDLMVEMASKKI